MIKAVCWGVLVLILLAAVILALYIAGMTLYFHYQLKDGRIKREYTEEQRRADEEQTKSRFRQSGKYRQGKKKSVRKGGKERVKQTGGKRDGCNKQREGGCPEMDARPDLPGREEKEAA